MPISKADGVVVLSVPWLALVAAGCGKVANPGAPPADALVADAADVGDAAIDGAAIDGGPLGPLGSKDNPAHTCAELNLAKLPSAVYWVPTRRGRPRRSRSTASSSSTAAAGRCWRTACAATMARPPRSGSSSTHRLKQIGTLAVDQNYYNGALYLIGKEYMDVFVDLQGKTAVAAVMTAAGFNATTMQFAMPTLTVGNAQVFNGQFASGWSAQDFDGDAGATANCAGLYSNVAQHYNDCWAYSLGPTPTCRPSTAASARTSSMSCSPRSACRSRPAAGPTARSGASRASRAGDRPRRIGSAVPGGYGSCTVTGCDDASFCQVSTVVIDVCARAAASIGVAPYPIRHTTVAAPWRAGRGGSSP